MGGRFEWMLLDGLGLPLPWVLWGGLGADNVAEAIRSVRPAAIDVAGCVAESPGKKDPAKVRAFIEAARRPL